jgi:hypothetical protein
METSTQTDNEKVIRALPTRVGLREVQRFSKVDYRIISGWSNGKGVNPRTDRDIRRGLLKMAQEQAAFWNGLIESNVLVVED